MIVQREFTIRHMGRMSALNEIDSNAYSSILVIKYFKVAYKPSIIGYQHVQSIIDGTNTASI